MRQNAMLLTGLIVAVGLAGCQTGARQKVELPEPVSVLARYQGNAPGLKEPQVTLVRSKKELEALGSKKLAKKVDVNFKKQALAVFALGEKPTGGYWARIDSLQLEGETLWVTGRANKPSENQQVTQQVTHPYSAVVIPKVDVERVRRDISSVVAEPMPSSSSSEGMKQDGGKSASGKKK